MIATLEDFARIAPGDEVPELTVEIDRLDVVKYAGAADDYVRVHWDHPFVTAQGYPDVIVHGWLSYAHMCRAVTDWISPRLATFAKYGVRYQRPLHPGALICGGKVIEASDGIVSIALWGKDAHGNAVATGTVTLKSAALPGEPSTPSVGEGACPSTNFGRA
jgi:acyl dehydratase